MKIFIDQGHNDSGWNTGAVGNGMREQDISYDVGFMLAGELKKHGIDTMLSRKSRETNLGANNTSSITARWQMANHWGADYFISIHCNAGGGQGAETFIAATKQADRAFAQAANDAYCEGMGLRNRGVKLDTQAAVKSIGVLRNTKMPAILVELAFIDAPAGSHDIAALRGKRYEMARALADGILSFVGQQQTLQQPAQGQGGAYPISDANMGALAALGCMDLPGRWKGGSKLEHLDRLIGNVVSSGMFHKHVDNNVPDAIIAVDVLRLGGQVSSPGYWIGALQSGIQPGLSQLLVDLANRSMNVLERIAWAEARGEDEKGQTLVCNVVMNRSKAPGFPDGIYPVVFQAGQFEPTRNGAYEGAMPGPRERRAALAALGGMDESKGALYFCTARASETSPFFTKAVLDGRLTFLFQHGNHRFFK